jgi:hypothetical protein
VNTYVTESPIGSIASHNIDVQKYDIRPKSIVMKNVRKRKGNGRTVKIVKMRGGPHVKNANPINKPIDMRSAGINNCTQY